MEPKGFKTHGNIYGRKTNSPWTGKWVSHIPVIHFEYTVTLYSVSLITDCPSLGHGECIWNHFGLLFVEYYFKWTSDSLLSFTFVYLIDSNTSLDYTSGSIG